MMWYGDHVGGWGWLLAGIGTLMFWTLLIVGVVFLVRYLGQAGRQPGPPPYRPGPEQVLAERFARGEIDEDEYRRRLSTLREQNQS